MNYLFASVVPGGSVGLAYVAAALKNTGRNVSCISLDSHQDRMVALLQKIEYEEIDVLGIGGLSADFLALRDAITVVREKHPRVKIIVGGNVITSEPEFVVNHLDMDFGCIGYGEETICEFAECLEAGGDFSTIRGLIYKNEAGVMKINSRRSQPENLDDIAFPALEEFGFYGGDSWLPMIVARSCTGSCTFCYRPEGYRYKKRSLDNIFLEIDYWNEKHSVTKIAFIDELFAKDSERILEFCRRIKEYCINYYIFLRVDVVTEMLIKALKESGCVGIYYGVESSSQKVLDSMRKGITVEQIEYALNIAHENHIRATGNLIFGDPAETYDIAKETQNWWFNNLHCSISLNMIRTHPGSILYKNAVKTGQIKNKLQHLENQCQPINLSAMSDADYIKLWRQNSCLSGLSRKPVLNTSFFIGANDEIFICGNCPYCGAKNYSDYSKIGLSFYRTFADNCTECNSVIVFEHEYNSSPFELRYFYEFNYSNKKVAVWGLSEKARFRLATNKAMRDAVILVVDSNYRNFKDKFLSFEIQSPKILSKTEFDVLYIGSSVARESILSMAREIVGSELYKKEIMIIS